MAGRSHENARGDAACPTAMTTPQMTAHVGTLAGMRPLPGRSREDMCICLLVIDVLIAGIGCQLQILGDQFAELTGVLAHETQKGRSTIPLPRSADREQATHRRHASVGDEGV